MVIFNKIFLPGELPVPVLPDAAFDQDKFGALIGELKDTYYANRFKTLVAQ